MSLKKKQLDDGAFHMARKKNKVRIRKPYLHSISFLRILQIGIDFAAEDEVGGRPFVLKLGLERTLYVLDFHRYLLFIVLQL